VIPEVDSAKALRLCDDYRIGVIELLAPDFYPFPRWLPSPLVLKGRGEKKATGSVR
jgi:hypothetical protein